MFQLFLKAVENLELLFNDKFVNHYQYGEKNGYKILLLDEQINMNPDKKDDNLAFASMELADFPNL